MTDVSTSFIVYVLPPKYQRIADRLTSLIEEAKQIEKIARRPEYPMSSHFSEEALAKLHKWLTMIDNLLRSVFGSKSAHFERFKILTADFVSYPSQVKRIRGVIEAAHDDLTQGFLAQQEFLIAAELFDSLLEQAKHLNSTGYKDSAAVLMRVVLEDALKRLARNYKIDDTLKASRINDELKKVQVYTQPVWRQIQAWLDIGNAAAHGQFGNYDETVVHTCITDVERFLAAEFA